MTPTPSLMQIMSVLEWPVTSSSLSAVEQELQASAPEYAMPHGAALPPEYVETVASPTPLEAPPGEPGMHRPPC